MVLNYILLGCPWLFSKLRMFWSKLCKSNWNCAWNLAFPVFISPIVWNMCENLHYESVYFKELHNDKEYYWPIIYRAGAAVVSTITSFNKGLQTFSVKYFWNHIFYVHSAQYKSTIRSKVKRFSRSTLKIYTPPSDLCATINLSCKLITAMSASWRNFPLSTPVKIASLQNKRPLSSPLILQICNTED